MISWFKKYLSSENLVQYQDEIIEKNIFYAKGEALKCIKELRKYDILFTDFFGLNPIATNNIAIRQSLVLSVLYFYAGNESECRKHKISSDHLFRNLLNSNYYMEGFSYFLYVKKAYDFYHNTFRSLKSNLLFEGSVSVETLNRTYKYFSSIAAPDRSVPVSETRFTDVLHSSYNPPKQSVYLANHTCLRFPDRDVYILINHVEDQEDYSRNSHVNYDFGHFTIFKNDTWLVKHPWYTGYKEKYKSGMLEHFEYNTIYPSSKKLSYYISNQYYNFLFNYGNGSSREIKVYFDHINVKDIGKGTSKFNLDGKTVFNVKHGSYSSKINLSFSESKISNKIVLSDRVREIDIFF